jgi:8-oxo-dGTP pyrophosphatase MutT (NUDIX family)
MATEATICYIRSGGKVLLKMSTRGMSKGYWNLPGGKIEKAETPRPVLLRCASSFMTRAIAETLISFAI